MFTTVGRVIKEMDDFAGYYHKKYNKTRFT